MKTETLKTDKQALNKHNVMLSFFWRVKNSITFGWWAFQNPKATNMHNMRVLTDLFAIIMRVATEDRHMMCNIAYIHPDEGEKQIVSLWVGAGIGAEPNKRITELLEENAMLKTQLKSSVALSSQKNGA